MTMKKLLFILCVFASTQVSAQKFGYGFKAGLNFSTILGPLEQDDQGNNLESHKYNSGFHIGAMAHYTFNDIVGVRLEFLFSQRGNKYKYNGTSYQRILLPNNEEVFIIGMQNRLVNVTNSYIDLPVSVFARVLPWLELSGGLSFGFMTNSSGAGELVFKGISPKGANIDEYTISLDYDYLKDKPGGIGNSIDETIDVNVDGNNVVLPKSFGAYYSNTNDLETPLFNKFEMGVVGGASIFLNQGLFLGLKVYYGVSDLTNNNADPVLYKRGESGYIFNNDVDRSLSFQTSIGFSF